MVSIFGDNFENSVLNTVWRYDDDQSNYVNCMNRCIDHNVDDWMIKLISI